MVACPAAPVAGGDASFRSARRGHPQGHGKAPTALAVEMPAHGLSVRDIKDAGKDETGRQLSFRIAVSEPDGRRRADERDSICRDLSERGIVQFFVDAIA